MRTLVIALIILLAILHHDFWRWDDATLVFRWIPIGLAWHVFYPLLASTTCLTARIVVELLAMF